MWLLRECGYNNPAFMAPLLKRTADPRNGANLFDDRMRKRWIVGLGLFK